MLFYISVILLTELMMLAMTLHVLHYSGFKKEQKVWYLLTFLTVMLCAGTEFAVHCGYYDPAWGPFLTVLTVIQFSVAPMLGILFSGALGLHNQGKIAVVFLIVNFLVETVAAPFRIVFYFDEEGYHRGELFLIYSLFYFASLIYLIVSMITVGRNFRHRDFRTICMVLVILIAGIVPMAVYKVNVTYIAIAIGASLCYIYYNDLVQQDIQAELVANQKALSGMQRNIINGLSGLLETRDTDTGGHISRTGDYVKKLAEDARESCVYTKLLDDHFISLLHTLAPMHDIGKIVIPDSILKKPGKFTPEEFEQMKRHTVAGGAVIRQILNGIANESELEFATDVVTYHHEKWDGSGYPNGLKGDAIPLSARITALADVFDALVSDRCYKEAMTPEEAFEEIRKESGT
ncbi:MAG: HD domain-containing protein, partial [Clostridia bacterium]|nr:HD domain-containing protein [Clostridia bacterium]